MGNMLRRYRILVHSLLAPACAALTASCAAVAPGSGDDTGPVPDTGADITPIDDVAPDDDAALDGGAPDDGQTGDDTGDDTGGTADAQTDAGPVDADATDADRTDAEPADAGTDADPDATNDAEDGTDSDAVRDVDPDLGADGATDAPTDVSSDAPADADPDADPVALLAIALQIVDDAPVATAGAEYGGAGNGILERGERAAVELTVANNFGRDITVVQARLEAPVNLELLDPTGVAAPRVVATGGEFGVSGLEVRSDALGAARVGAAIETSGLPTVRAGFDLVVRDVRLAIDVPALDDTVGGDGDGVADPGESIRASVELEAVGLDAVPPTPAAGESAAPPGGDRFVRLSATTASPLLEIVGAAGAVGPLEPGDLERLDGAITFVVAPTATAGEPACIDVVVTSGAGATTAWTFERAWCTVIGFGETGFCIDGDLDGYGAGDLCAGPDCDDTREDVSPVALDVCNDIDDDCDGRVDNGVDFTSDDANCGACGRVCGAYTRCLDAECVAYCDDVDGDGAPGAGLCATAGADCDDGRADVSPLATEVCGNGTDEDCDGRDGICPTACDPIAQNCPIGGKCSLNAVSAFVCGFAGTVLNRAPCSGEGLGDTCAAGGICIEWDTPGTRTCHEMCASDLDCSDTQTVCLVTLSAGATPLVDVCAYTPTCSPLTQNCAGSQRCDSWYDPRSPVATFRCFDNGSVPLGGDCSAPGAFCARGGACISDGVTTACRSYCTLPSGAGCSFSEGCASITDWPSTIGACIPF